VVNDASGADLAGRSPFAVSVARALSLLADIFLWAGAIAVLAMMVHVTADVLMKVALNQPIMGTLEIVSFVYMVGCTFLPLAHVQLSRTLIIVEVFTQNLAPEKNLRFDIGAAVLTVAYLSLLAIMGAVVAVAKTGIGEAQDATYFDLPVWPMRWVFCISCGLAALIALYQLVDDFRLARFGRRFDGSARIKLGDHPI
jgi:TRAP-type C4-dicarboxylate transport system permease small subunit